MRTPLEAMQLALAVIAVSVTMSFVVTQCSKNETDDKKAEPKPDVHLLDYLEYAPPRYLEEFKKAYKTIIPEEGFTYYEMPFEEGFVKGYGSEIPCKKHPVVYWKKETKESVCIVTVFFDCQPKYLSHTSQCIIL